MGKIDMDGHRIGGRTAASSSSAAPASASITVAVSVPVVIATVSVSVVVAPVAVSAAQAKPVFTTVARGSTSAARVATTWAAILYTSDKVVAAGVLT